jgi:hypothetical protein
MPLFESDTAATRTDAGRHRALGAEINTIDAATSTTDISDSLPGSKAGIHAVRSGSSVDSAYTAVATRLSAYADASVAAAETFDNTEVNSSTTFKVLRLQ